jgi:carbamoyltransferase
MAGGGALNCVANGRILREGPFEELFVQPAASDAGAALRCRGDCASADHRNAAGGTARARVFLGPRIRATKSARCCGAAAFILQTLSDDAALVDHVAERLARGEVVGWFQGAMEFGPRALGARFDSRRPPQSRDARPRQRVRQKARSVSAVRAPP